MSDAPGDLAAFFPERDSADVLARLDLSGVPAHVAIIMDGNGRWAQSRHLPRVAGHRAGAKAVREAITTSLELGIRYLTIYSFSSENWQRPQDEVAGLMRLFVEVLDRELTNLLAEGVALKLIGRRDRMPADVLATFEKAEAATEANNRLDLVIALDYGGRAEIVGAARELGQQVAAGRLSAEDITEELFASHLHTKSIPDPDLLIRTSGEMRVSNFLLWQIAYSELWITDVMWPDFSRYDLLDAIVEYQGRQRRFGA